MYGTCDVPGCSNETFMGWRPLSEPLGKQICEPHWNRHKDPADSFNLFDVFSFKRPAGIRKSMTFKAEPHFAQEAKKRQRLSQGRGKKGVAKLPHLKQKARDEAAKAMNVSGRYVSATKKLRREEPEAGAIPTTDKPSGCRACGGQREAGHTYCRMCGRERKKQADRERQKRRYEKRKNSHAFARF